MRGSRVTVGNFVLEELIARSCRKRDFGELPFVFLSTRGNTVTCTRSQRTRF